MRELIGKLTTKDPSVVKRVYLAEMVRCSECQKTMPFGIEVIALKKIGDTKKVIEHRWYCRAHGFRYEMSAQHSAISEVDA